MCGGCWLSKIEMCDECINYHNNYLYADDCVNCGVYCDGECEFKAWLKGLLLINYKRRKIISLQFNKSNQVCLKGLIFVEHFQEQLKGEIKELLGNWLERIDERKECFTDLEYKERLDILKKNNDFINNIDECYPDTDTDEEDEDEDEEEDEEK